MQLCLQCIRHAVVPCRAPLPYLQVGHRFGVAKSKAWRRPAFERRHLFIPLACSELVCPFMVATRRRRACRRSIASVSNIMRFAVDCRSLNATSLAMPSREWCCLRFMIQSPNKQSAASQTLCSNDTSSNNMSRRNGNPSKLDIASWM